ncbi:hypothetical protein [Streptomyces sp. NPDC050287]
MPQFPDDLPVSGDVVGAGRVRRLPTELPGPVRVQEVLVDAPPGGF